MAPISHVLDAIGLLARNVEDCELLDAVLTGGTVSGSDDSGDLKDVRFAYAPRQHLLDVDEQTDGIFRETLRKRGHAGYEKYRSAFAKLIWQTALPNWRFDDATFERTAKAFDNPDHVSIVIHNYRWRLGLADGQSKYDGLEKQLAAGPVITVPTITLESDGAPQPDPGSYAKKFSGKYKHRLLNAGIGHNLPQEAPRQFADAIIEVDRF